MNARFLEHLAAQTETLQRTGLFKQERTITSPQQAVVTIEGGREVINLCANDDPVHRQPTPRWRST